MPLTDAQNRTWLAEITRWAEDNGCFPCLRKGVAFQRHHVLGRKYKQDKVQIGQEYVLPIEEQYHEVHEVNDLNVTHYPKNFEGEWGSQRSMFAYMIQDMLSKGYDVIPSEEVVELISTTKCWDWSKEFTV